MKQKIEDVLSKYSDELMDIYFSMDSGIQALSDKEKYLLKAAVDVEKFLHKATGGNAVSYTHLYYDHFRSYTGNNVYKVDDLGRYYMFA